MEDTETELRCALCERTPEKEDENWLDVDVRVGEDDYYLWFCSQDHAAEWFSRPLPPVEGAESAAVDSGDGVLFGIVFTTMLLAVLGLIGIGICTVVGWLF
ncbi:hypothetical protein FHX82_002315 [Amycolatopsis bartoniae]|uniref:Uncharacterized protein n=1 Tax=Amycolatopsis bartoniae TaxID=941986 RepID=A0A8H9IVZ9_9PSEU|nr:hypothetical protein [Amycolatopsis bartoniae]MBB2935295.1 hypothetical protein [Amycolatopsis bartoniae]TVT06802.1 hypothetical protein FNH07_18710 [Amycolatopsis bartoniae]GHF55821.1 hypothetical protein GCM10017566_31090 [Amycolatopsis bartoniae]